MMLKIICAGNRRRKEVWHAELTSMRESASSSVCKTSTCSAAAGSRFTGTPVRSNVPVLAELRTREQ